jgi:hypothetical protein
MSILAKLFTHSGGLIYHARAWRAGHTWKSHRNSVRDFLNAWNPPADTLVLVGPSGGYSLPAGWLKKFDEVIAVEPDPVARALFEWRLKMKLTWLSQPLDFNDPSLFLAQIPPKSAILFCNLLGQVSVSSAFKMKATLQKITEGRPWASYHDVISGTGIHLQVPAATDFKKKTVDEIKTWVNLTAEARAGDSTVRELSLHDAFDLFPAGEGVFHYWDWTLTGTRTHLIEGVYHD